MSTPTGPGAADWRRMTATERQQYGYKPESRAYINDRTGEGISRRQNAIASARRGPAQPAHRRQLIEQMAAEGDAKREEASRLEQEAEQMLH